MLESRWQNFPEGFLPDGMDAEAATARGEIKFTMSSGTSGARLQFASSEKRRAAQEISGQLINWLFFDPKSILCALTPIPASGTSGSQTQRWCSAFLKARKTSGNQAAW